jgi:hypothetical protein
MFCINCGNRLRDGSSFCDNCGSRVQGDATTAPSPDLCSATPDPSPDTFDPHQQTPDPYLVAPGPYSTTPDPYQQAPDPYLAEPDQYSDTPDPFPPAAGSAMPYYSGASHDGTTTEIIDSETDAAETDYPATPAFAASAPSIVTLEPVPERQAELRTKSAPSAARALGRALLSILLGILAFAFAFAFVALTIVRPGNIPDMLEQTDITWILEESGLGESIIEGIIADTENEIEIDIHDIGEFLRRDAVSGELGRIAEGYIRAIAEGDLGYALTSRDIAGMLRAIAPDIQDQFGYRLTQDNLDSIIESLDEHLDLRELRVDNLLSTANLDSSVPFIVFSVYPLIITGILFALAIFNVFLLHRKKVRAAFLTVGVPVFVAGLIFVLAGFLLSALTGLFGGVAAQVLGIMTGGIAHLMLLHGLYCLAAGVLSLVVFSIIKSVKKRRERIPSDICGDSARKSARVWRIAGLAANTALLLGCAAVALLFYLNIP